MAIEREYTPCKATHEELCNAALRHYEEMSAIAMHWNSVVPKAIEFYRDNYVDTSHYQYLWRGWQCWLMSKLDFRYWRCECHYQPPYGKVIMGGCPKHD